MVEVQRNMLEVTKCGSPARYNILSSDKGDKEFARVCCYSSSDGCPYYIDNGGVLLITGIFRGECIYYQRQELNRSTELPTGLLATVQNTALSLGLDGLLR